MSEVVKMTINISKEAADAVRKLASEKGTTVTNIVNKAIATEEFLQQEIQKGSRIQVEDKNGKIREIIFR
jgi:hypothetical protein